MNKIVLWIKTHKLAALFLVILLYFILKDKLPLPSPIAQRSPRHQSPSGETTQALSSTIMPPVYEAAPTTSANRLISQDSYLSLVVEDVAATQKAMIQKAVELGGYMVNSELINPQEAPSATVTLRVPSAQIQSALSYFKNLAVKVVAENLEGDDVTDEYVDIETRLTTLLKTKAKFEAIIEQAVKVPDILEVQRELINLQSQIDSLKGQQNYLERTAQMAKITLYLSTDELSLPYSPSQSWRPKAIFKEAVRSVVELVRKIGTAIIWIAVYAVIWVPLTIIILFIRKKRSSKRYRN